MQLPIATGTLDLSTGRHERDDGTSVRLTQREKKLLEYLAARPGEDVSRDALLADVWGHHDLSLSRAVDTAVARLRKKIERDPRVPQALCTAHGEGYRLVLEVPVATATVPTLDTALPVLELGDRRVDLGSGIVEGDAGRDTLTCVERRMLLELVRRPGVVVDPARLIRLAGVTGGRSALSNAIYRLRAKIEPDPADPRWLVGVRGQGYRLDAAPAAKPHGLEALHETLWAVADHAGALLGLDDCVVYARDGNYLVQVAAFGRKVAQHGKVADPIALRVGEGIVGNAARIARPQCVADVLNDRRYVQDLAQARSELAMPIIADAEVVGVIDSESPDVGAYGERHRAGFRSLAVLAAAAARDVSRALAA